MSLGNTIAENKHDTILNGLLSDNIDKNISYLVTSRTFYKTRLTLYEYEQLFARWDKQAI